MERFPDIKTAAEPGGTPYYTNSSHLPVGYTDDLFSALDIQDGFQTLYTFGTVFHAFLGERLSDWQTAAKLVRKIAENYGLPYYTLSLTYSICREHGYLAGEQPECPVCHKKTEVYSRITGYYRPVQNWNDGKAQEYKQRGNYQVGNILVSGLQSILSDDGTYEKETGRRQKGDVLLKLFTTATCLNCRIAKEKFHQAGISPEVILAEEQPELCKQYSILQVPTMVAESNEGVSRYIGVSEILRFIADFL